MADEKNTPAKGQDDKQKSGENKVIAWFKNLPSRIATPFKNMVTELKRVTWPTKEKLIRYSALVLLFMLFMVILIGLFDMGSTAAVNGLTNLGGSRVATTGTDLPITGTDLPITGIDASEEADSVEILPASASDLADAATGTASQE